jgi:NitT/TauT family transport system permease protein
MAALAVSRAGKGLVGVLAAVGGWEVLRATGVLPAQNAPSVVAIVRTAVAELAAGPLATATLQTIYAWSAGMVLTILIAVPLGVLVGFSRWVDAATALLFDFVRPIPAVALVPVAIVLLGLGLHTQMFLIAVAAVWPLLFNTRYGVRNVDPLLLASGRVAGLGRLALVRRVVLPAALPAILTGLRLAASIAVVLTVVTELVAVGTGVGHYIDLHYQVGDAREAFAGVLVVGVFGYLVNVGMLAVDRRLVRWRGPTVGGSG